MKIKNTLLAHLIILLMILLSACKGQYSNRDPFYNEGSEFDSLGFPLIKPYFAMMIFDEYGWGINLQLRPSERDFYYYMSIENIEKISVDNGIIMVYSPLEVEVEESVGQKVLHWFVIIPNENIEMGFETELEFLNYIQRYGIDHPTWRSPSDILHEYDSTRCLDWIPDC